MLQGTAAWNFGWWQGRRRSVRDSRPCRRTLQHSWGWSWDSFKVDSQHHSLGLPEGDAGGDAGEHRGQSAATTGSKPMPSVDRGRMISTSAEVWRPIAPACRRSRFGIQFA